jgi:PGF-CTERM protein
MRQRITAALMIFVVTTSAVLVGAAPAAAGDTTAETTDEASVTFNEQMSGGYTITVNKVSLPDGGFVTIHDSSLTDGDTLGSVVGTSAYLEAGTHENVTITLDKSLSEDDTLHAMAHQDTDGDRAYTFVSSSGQADGPYTADDNIVMQSAGVTVSATVSMTDQPTDGTSVVVYSVELSEGGFVTIHDGSLLDGATFDSVRGTSEYLEAGHHENVCVQLDEPLGEDATVIPMPHQDSNDNEMYDFVEDEGGADGPYADDDGAIVDTAATSLQSEASATFAAQTTGSNHVTVEQVFVPEGGFVTMHDSSINDGAVFDSVRGTSEYLEPGLHRNVMVALDDPLNEDDSLVAMPHMDSNDNEMYDFVENEGGDDGPYTADGGAVVDGGAVTVSASVSLDEQTSDGTSVVVEDVDLSEGGFVTIHDSSLFAGEALGSVIGTSEDLEAGHHDEVTVTLDDPISETRTLVAMPHQDTNDNEMYDFVENEGGDDGPYADDNDAVVDSGTVTVLAAASISDQESDGTIVVDSVTLHDGGFVTVHDRTVVEGAVFDSVRGTSEYLGPGTHEDVEISLDEPYDEDGVAVAMPHQDTNDNEMYDFIDSEGTNDGPYVAAGGAVVADAAISASGSADDGGMDDEDTDDEGMNDEGMNDEEMNDEEMDNEGNSDDGSPGFGIAIAAVSLLAAAMLALRRSYQ